MDSPIPIPIDKMPAVDVGIGHIWMVLIFWNHLSSNSQTFDSAVHLSQWNQIFLDKLRRQIVVSKDGNHQRLSSGIFIKWEIFNSTLLSLGNLPIFQTNPFWLFEKWASRIRSGEVVKEWQIRTDVTSKFRINRVNWNVFASAASFEINSDLNTGTSSYEFTHAPKKNNNDIAEKQYVPLFLNILLKWYYLYGAQYDCQPPLGHYLRHLNRINLFHQPVLQQF